MSISADDLSLEFYILHFVEDAKRQFSFYGKKEVGNLCDLRLFHIFLLCKIK